MTRVTRDITTHRLVVEDDGKGNLTLVATGDGYSAPNGKVIRTGTSLDSLLSDDFGGSAIDATKWDVLNGGLGLNPDLGFGVQTQAAIGSGTTGITDNVTGSQLVVSMGTTNGAERWYLSKQVFCGKEDIMVTLQRSQAIAANSIFIGLVEVDPVTLVPLLNANFAGEFANRGGCEFGLTTTTTAFQAEAIGDSSAAKATGNVGAAGVALTSLQEFLIEVDARDIIVSSATVDSTAAKAAGASRVSSQAPNDTKLYKLVMRFRNVGVPTATTVTIGRVLVVDNYEQRVQISSGEGDNLAAKAVPVNIAGGTGNVNAALVAGTQFVGSVALQPATTNGPTTSHKLTAAASTNATSVKATGGMLSGGYVRNRSASEKYFKLYNKASAPVVGTDVPVMTIGIPANDRIALGDLLGSYGFRFSAGIAYALTGAFADADTTALTAGDVDVNLIYT
jgi:hypothetical protein